MKAMWKSLNELHRSSGDPMGAEQIIRDLVTQVTTEEPRLVKLWRNNQEQLGTTEVLMVSHLQGNYLE